MKSLVTVGVALTVMIVFATPVKAQQERFGVDVTVRSHVGPVTGSSSDSFLSFSSPVGVPGVGLAAGTYIFRRITPSVMQVLSEDRSTVYAMFFVIPTSRAEVTDEYAVKLRRIRDDAPPRVTAVFPPAALTGYQPMYPARTTSTG